MKPLLERHLTEREYKTNFKSFVWHAVFLAIASNFMDIDTILPAMLLEAGGSNFHLGLLTFLVILMGRFSQLFFGNYISKQYRKKPFLLWGINLRIASLAAISLLFVFYSKLNSQFFIWIVLLMVGFFALSGAFANVAFSDLLGKSILENKRKNFFSLKQILSSVLILISAFIAGKLIISFSFPYNYALVFMMATLFLALASLGFWNIVESKSLIKNDIDKKGYKRWLAELKKSRRLRQYLLLINVFGLGYTIFPFIVLMYKERIANISDFIGTLLVFKTIGLTFSGIALYYFAKRISYRKMAYIIFVLSLFFPLFVWIDSTNEWMYALSFFLGGILLSVYSVFSNGMLLEISNTENRAVYTGIAGAGNILPLIFPLLGFLSISYFDFHLVFTIYIALNCFTFFLIPKLQCDRA